MIKENRNFKIEKEIFEVRCQYEKELHSNKNGLSTIGFMAILGLVALATQGKESSRNQKEMAVVPKAPASVCVHKGISLCEAKAKDEFVHSR